VKWYKFAAAEYQIKTIHLSDAEDLAYRRLLDMAYLSEKPIPLDTNLVSRRIRLDQDIVEQVLAEFFERTESGFRNRRVEEEVQAYQAIIERNLKGTKAAAEKAAERAAQGMKRKSPRTKNEPTSNHSHDLDGSHEGILEGSSEGTANHEGFQNKNKNISPLPPSGGFDRFWSTWPTSPRKVGKAACFKIWVKNGMDENTDRIVSHVSRLKGTTQWLTGFEPAPQTYLNQKRWLADDVASTALPFGRKVL
jgi:uncharacterized protein YdaU (DUF1376 family)